MQVHLKFHPNIYSHAAHILIQKIINIVLQIISKFILLPVILYLLIDLLKVLKLIFFI